MTKHEFNIKSYTELTEIYKYVKALDFVHFDLLVSQLRKEMAEQLQEQICQTTQTSDNIRAAEQF